MTHHRPRNRMFRRNSKQVRGADDRQPTLETLDENTLRSMFASSADVVIKSFPAKKVSAIPALLIYSEGMVDAMVMTQYVLPDLEEKLEHFKDWEPLARELDKSMEWSEINEHADVVKLLFEGRLILFFSTEKCFYSIDIAARPNRQPEESNTEVAIKGARDAFTEDIITNVALVRKRLRTATLHNEQMVIGDRSQTRVALLYISDIIRPEVINDAKDRLQGIKVDALVTSGQLEEALSDSTLSLFPQMDYIGRPDFVVECLLRGRFVILVDGSPMALIAPCNLMELLKTPEDSYFPYYFVIFERILRLLGLFLAIMLPGFWIALTSYNMDQLPFLLLATVTVSRFGLPLSSPMEILLMLGMFELFREAGVRLPKAVGQTIAVLGGLIIGDAAIRAGLTSPTMLVVSATTAVATFTLVNQTLSGTVSIIRLYVLIWSSLLGMLGFFIGILSLIAYLSVLESFGLPYLAPVSPLTIKDLMNSLLKKPWAFNKKRPQMLQTIDDTSEEREPT
ncbi:spore germination protein [Paenibacillus lautus]|uniref:spore germination protein n=1 Tax=Paenibacillus lautus TaxID=1401 RepID=UPI002DB5F282|nr:spore germination protein [Paenibacillus lautus]MEC0201465.1 spore germination protein [Paenibacillus lautus]